jgi:hypothetical protein
MYHRILGKDEILQLFVYKALQEALSHCVTLIKKRAMLVSDFRLHEDTVSLSQLLSTEGSS